MESVSAQYPSLDFFDIGLEDYGRRAASFSRYAPNYAAAAAAAPPAAAAAAAAAADAAASAAKRRTSSFSKVLLSRHKTSKAAASASSMPSVQEAHYATALWPTPPLGGTLLLLLLHLLHLLLRAGIDCGFSWPGLVGGTAGTVHNKSQSSSSNTSSTRPHIHSNTNTFLFLSLSLSLSRYTCNHTPKIHTNLHRHIHVLCSSSSSSMSPSSSSMSFFRRTIPSFCCCCCCCFGLRALELPPMVVCWKYTTTRGRVSFFFAFGRIKKEAQSDRVPKKYRFLLFLYFFFAFVALRHRRLDRRPHADDAGGAGPLGRRRLGAGDEDGDGVGVGVDVGQVGQRRPRAQRRSVRLLALLFLPSNQHLKKNSVKKQSHSTKLDNDQGVSRQPYRI